MSLFFGGGWWIVCTAALEDLSEDSVIFSEVSIFWSQAVGGIFLPTGSVFAFDGGIRLF